MTLRTTLFLLASLCVVADRPNAKPRLPRDAVAPGGILRVLTKHSPHVAGCGLSAACGLTINALCMRHSILPDTLAGSPLFSYYVSLVYQIVLFPACLLLAIKDWQKRARKVGRNASFGAWVRSGWAGASHWRAIFHYVAFGYFAKDLIIPLEAEIYAHHVLCSVLAALSLADFQASPIWCVLT